MAKWLTVCRPQRTARLIWFTGEEVDRRGSCSYVQAHHDELVRMRLYLNVDSGVSLDHGEPRALLSGPPELAGQVRHLLDQSGEDMPIGAECGSASDTRAFREAGIPTVHVSARRVTPPPHPHLPTDSPERIDPAKLERIGRASVAIATAVLRGDIL